MRAFETRQSNVSDCCLLRQQEIS